MKLKRHVLEQQFKYGFIGISSSGHWCEWGLGLQFNACWCRYLVNDEPEDTRLRSSTGVMVKFLWWVLQLHLYI